MKIFNLINNDEIWQLIFLGIKFTKNKRFKKKPTYNMYDTRFFYALRQTIKLSLNEKIWYISQNIYNSTGYFPNLKEPKSFNEKLGWMRINYYDPIEKQCSDKYEFKNYINKLFGSEYIIPLIGVYDDVNDIDFSKLPRKFVIKTTSNGAAIGIKIVKDKSKLDIDALKAEYNTLIQDWHKGGKEFLSPVDYKVKQRIIIEEYAEQIAGQLYDYKFFCFHGKAKFVYVAIDHFPGVKSKISLFDLNWNRLPITYDGHPEIDIEIKRPKNFNKMLELAEKAASSFPFVRVDFYETNDSVLFGEFTFFPGCGFGKYKPIDWDYKMGEWLDLKKLPKENVYIQEGFEIHD